MNKNKNPEYPIFILLPKTRCTHDLFTHIKYCNWKVFGLSRHTVLHPVLRFPNHMKAVKKQI